MAVSPLPGAYNEIHWPGANDPPGHADDCVYCATAWALVAAGVLTEDQLPTIKAFRAAAGVPDVPASVSHGMSCADALRAVRKLVPQARAELYAGGYAGFKARLAGGAAASLTVHSGHLPPALRHGFSSIHQVGVARAFRLMNPLAEQGSEAVLVRGMDLAAAAYAYLGDGKFHAVVIPAPPADPHVARIATLAAQVAALVARNAATAAALAAAKAALAAAQKKVADWRAWLAGAPK